MEEIMKTLWLHKDCIMSICELDKMAVNDSLGYFIGTEEDLIESCGKINDWIEFVPKTQKTQFEKLVEK